MDEKALEKAVQQNKKAEGHLARITERLKGAGLEVKPPQETKKKELLYILIGALPTRLMKAVRVGWMCASCGSVRGVQCMGLLYCG